MHAKRSTTNPVPVPPGAGPGGRRRQAVENVRRLVGLKVWLQPHGRIGGIEGDRAAVMYIKQAAVGRGGHYSKSVGRLRFPITMSDQRRQV